MSDVSDAVRTRLEHASTLLSALELHAHEVTSRLDALLSPEGGASSEATLRALTSALEFACARMTRADEELTAEADDDKQYRDARDRATDSLRSVITDVRSMFEAAYGPDILVFYGMAEEAPRSPEVLLEHALHVISLMEHRDMSERSPYGFDLDVGLLARRVRVETEPLAQALVDIERELREIREALAARNDAMLDFDQIFEGAASALFGYFTMAGRPDLAELVRTTPRRT